MSQPDHSPILMSSDEFRRPQQSLVSYRIAFAAKMTVRKMKRVAEMEAAHEPAASDFETGHLSPGDEFMETVETEGRDRIPSDGTAPPSKNMVETNLRIRLGWRKKHHPGRDESSHWRDAAFDDLMNAREKMRCSINKRISGSLSRLGKTGLKKDWSWEGMGRDDESIG